MDALFYVIPVLIIAVLLFAAVGVIRRARAANRAWSSGLTAEARCLRTYTTTSGGSGDTSVTTRLNHVYEFTTREGRTVRFEERGGPGTVLEGDIVTVYYTADHPERATAEAPARGKLLARTGAALAFFGVFIAFCVGFIVVTHEAFSTAGDFMSP
ncbi:DUF3592 domain-containing protein [Streptomyces sp. NPDC088350]|uniref:DUF3592 domain-containing protein n=1 Tax=Streptomyces sp. NPDC088350 TaxID=3365854 RepID=UPI00381EE9F6